MLENTKLQEFIEQTFFGVIFFYFREIFITFPHFKNDGFQLCLQENNKLITSLVVSASVIMKEGMREEIRQEVAREFYHIVKKGAGPSGRAV